MSMATTERMALMCVPIQGVDKAMSRRNHENNDLLKHIRNFIHDKKAVL